jgi:polyribonucleotide nucleotidyltransferase
MKYQDMLKKEEVVSKLANGQEIRLETGRIAKQAAGSAIVQMGDAVLLATVCYGPEKEDQDFFPLTVEYREKAYAAGRIPGGYIKREARPSEHEILSARVVDRPIRPMFPEGYTREVQIIITVLSADKSFDVSALGVSAASLAIGLSDLPFEKQVAAVQVAVVDGKNIVNPTYAEMEMADLELVVAGTEDSVTMVEGGAWEVAEEVVIGAIMAGHEEIKTMCRSQEELVAKAAKEKLPFAAPEVDGELLEKVSGIVREKLRAAFRTDMVKSELYPFLDKVKDELLEELGEEYEDKFGKAKAILHDIEREEMRSMILSEGRRLDGRDGTTVRPIEIETKVLPSSHGSSIFQRGETQGLVVCTLGTKTDEQRVESLQGEAFKNYMLHYNFPPFSVGEAKRIGSVSRREIGHGHLAERSLAPVLPHPEDFPYTIRVVSEIMESNGSSSMASVCGGSLSLMDAGVPIKTAVAGIAMGLISEGDDVAILSDITGTEDHLGDMDFKVTGTKDGITAFQMDIKIKGITPELMGKAMEQARAGRLHILEKMNTLGLSESRADISEQAPAVLQMKINSSKIRDVIGPGGANIKHIQSSTATDVNISDDGRVEIYAPSRKAGEVAKKMISEIVAEIEPGKVYNGKVKSIVAFGAFVEVLPGKEGLVHISEIAKERIDKVEDVLSLGDEIKVKCIGVDPRGKVKLSMKALLEDEAAE